MQLFFSSTIKWANVFLFKKLKIRYISFLFNNNRVSRVQVLMAEKIITLVFQVYMIMLFIRIFGSWFPDYQRHPLMLFISFYTDPYLNLFRKFIPPIGMVDISPMAALFALQFIEHYFKKLVGFFII